MVKRLQTGTREGCPGKEIALTMAKKIRSIDRVIYEDKPVCGRCGAGIIGVIPKRRDGKPLCRECAFELEEMRLKSGGKLGEPDEPKAVYTREEITRRNVLIGVLAVTVVFLLFRVYTLAPLLEDPKPLRAGIAETDTQTDRCINNLWRLSRDLQNRKLPNILPLCPRSSKQYVVTELEDDTVIDCPTPGEHSLARLSVSLNSPIPNARAGEEP